MIFLLPKVVFLVLYINIQSSWQLESLLDLGPGPFDGLDVEEEVLESLQEHPWSASTNNVGETNKKVRIQQRGI